MQRLRDTAAVSRSTDRSCRRDTLRFAVWSDCRGDVLVFERLLESIRGRSPAFHVGLGDLVGMARPYQFEILRERLDGVGTPYLVLPGNHDRDPDGTLSAFRSVFGPPDRDLGTKHAVIVALDTSGGLSDSDVEGVERRLSQAAREATQRPLRRRHEVLLTHYPVFPPAGRPDKALRDGPALERLRALVRARKITVFAGNWHAYDVLDLGGHAQVVTGGAGSKPEWDGPFHWVEVTVDVGCSAGDYAWSIVAKQANRFNGPPGNEFVLVSDPGSLRTSVSGGCALRFAAQASAWLAFLVLGLWNIRRGRVAQHRLFMLLMTATASGAIFFRIYLASWVILAQGRHFAVFYACDAWIAWLLPLLATLVFAKRTGGWRSLSR